MHLDTLCSRPSDSSSGGDRHSTSQAAIRDSANSHCPAPTNTQGRTVSLTQGGSHPFVAKIQIYLVIPWDSRLCPAPAGAMDGDANLGLLRLNHLCNRTWGYKHPSQSGSRPGLPPVPVHQQDATIVWQAGPQELEINTLSKVWGRGMPFTSWRGSGMFPWQWRQLLR